MNYIDPQGKFIQYLGFAAGVYVVAAGVDAAVEALAYTWVDYQQREYFEKVYKQRSEQYKDVVFKLDDGCDIQRVQQAIDQELNWLKDMERAHQVHLLQKWFELWVNKVPGLASAVPSIKVPRIKPPPVKKPGKVESQ
jgi:hypothetical protein